MKYYFNLTAIVILFIFNCTDTYSQKQIILTGKFDSFPDKPMVYISSSKSFKDSVNLINGVFKFKVPANNEWDAYFITCRFNNNIFSFPLLLNENSDLKIEVNKTLDQYTITGDKNAIEQNLFWKGMCALNTSIKLIDQQISNANNDHKIAQLKVQLDTLNQQINNYPKTWVEKHLGSPFSPAIIRMFISKNPKYGEDTIAEKYFDLLEPIAIQNNYQAELLKDNFALFNDKYSKLPVGGTMPYFAVKDTLGKDIRLSDFNNKYLLIDFWASWCVPCRENNPKLIEIYNKYHKDKLEILSISLDQNSREWKNAIRKDKLIWLQGSDLMGGDGGIGAECKITAVPQYILLDPQGKIIFKSIGGEINSLEPKLIGLL